MEDENISCLLFHHLTKYRTPVSSHPSWSEPTPCQRPDSDGCKTNSVLVLVSEPLGFSWLVSAFDFGLNFAPKKWHWVIFTSLACYLHAEPPGKAEGWTQERLFSLLLTNLNRNPSLRFLDQQWHHLLWEQLIVHHELIILKPAKTNSWHREIPWTVLGILHK